MDTDQVSLFVQAKVYEGFLNWTHIVCFGLKDLYILVFSGLD